MVYFMKINLLNDGLDNEVEAFFSVDDDNGSLNKYYISSTEVVNFNDDKYLELIKLLLELHIDNFGFIEKLK